jgi:predicted Zn-dependent protease with MMP-like domain
MDQLVDGDCAARRHVRRTPAVSLSVMSTEVAPERFAELVSDALDDVPVQFTTLMDNIAVLIDDDSPPGDRFGEYVGVPLTARGMNYTSTLPDRIVLFRQTICAYCYSEEDVRRQVAVTVVHEIAHHFGIDDDRLHELGWG